MASCKCCAIVTVVLIVGLGIAGFIFQDLLEKYVVDRFWSSSADEEKNITEIEFDRDDSSPDYGDEDETSSQIPTQGPARFPTLTTILQGGDGGGERDDSLETLVTDLPDTTTTTTTMTFSTSTTTTIEEVTSTASTTTTTHHHDFDSSGDGDHLITKSNATNIKIPDDEDYGEYVEGSGTN